MHWDTVKKQTALRLTIENQPMYMASRTHPHTYINMVPEKYCLHAIFDANQATKYITNKGAGIAPSTRYKNVIMLPTNPNHKEAHLYLSLRYEKIF